MEKEKQFKNEIRNEGEIEITEESIKERRKEEQKKLEEITKEKHEEWQVAKGEKRKIEKEIEALEAMGDKEENEPVAIEKYGDLYKAETKSRTALREYILARIKSDPKSREKYGLTELDRTTLSYPEMLDKSGEKRKKIIGW